MGSKIEWTDETWNPVTGCDKVSPGCANCYAERIAKRLAANPNVYCFYKYDGFQVATWADRLGQPLHWTKPRRIFVCSMGDLFHKKVPWSFIKRVFETMEQAPQHIYQVLTKRSRDMAEWGRHHPDTPDHVWFGVTAENQEWADRRIPDLLHTPSAIRFVSAEPMLGPLTLSKYLTSHPTYPSGKAYKRPALDWVIVGCESGPKRRPMKLKWAIDLVEQCREFQVPVFVKQVPINGRVSKNPDEWPEVLRVREYPE